MTKTEAVTKLAIYLTATLIQYLVIAVAIIVPIVILAILHRAIKEHNQKQPPEKRIERKTNGKIIAGICITISEKVNLDPTIIRCVWALFSLMKGAGVLLYVMCWIAVPKEKQL